MLGSRAVALAAAVAAVGSPALARAERALSGVVTDEATRAPIAGATVAAATIETVTGADGTFAIGGVPGGVFDVFVLADGYEPRLLRARAGRGLAIALAPERGGTEVVEIQGAAPLTAAPAARLTQEEIKTLPGGGGDALRSLQSLPGVARIPFGLGGLALRGTAPRDTHVFLDGIQVPILYHFGGLASFVPTGILARIELQPGSFGVAHGRGLGGVALVDTRAGRRDRWRAGGEISLLDAAALAEGPGPQKGSWLVGVRRSYADAILALAPIDLTLLPRYFDAQVRWESGDGAWTALGFASDDNLHLVRTPTGGDTPGGMIDASNVGAFDYQSRFARVGVRWRRTVARTALTIVPSVGVDKIQAIANHKGVDKGQVRTSASSALRASAVTPFDQGRVEVGFDASVVRHHWTIDGKPPPPNDMEFEHIDGTRTTGDLGLWAEVSWARADDAIGIRPGVRIDHLGLAGQWTVDPRISVTHRAPHCLTITESLGLYHQPPSIVDLQRDPDRALGASWSVQGSVAVTAPLRDQASVSATIYGQDLHELPVDVVSGATPVSANGSGEAGGAFGVARELIDDQFGTYSLRDNRGRGYAYGAELMIRRDIGAVTGWLAYTYARSFRRGDPAREAPWLPYVLDQPHLVTVLASWRATARWRFGGRLRLVTGNPYTPVSAAFRDVEHSWSAIDGPLLSERLPSFVQIDLRVDRTWQRRWGKLAVFLDLQNAANRANAEGVTYNEDYTRRGYTRGLPIFPSLGVEYTPP